MKLFIDSANMDHIREIHEWGVLAGVTTNPSLIAKEGRDAFYKGVLAREMVDRLQEKGGLHTMEDFAEAKGTYESTITTEYRGNIIHECPPQGQGMIALLMLNMMRSARWVLGYRCRMVL